ncbi:tRNA pseudouridine(38-40) synthase TruA [Entomobacter blattae]|uniref:tRNA pseudouridine synthase A n=1 Tax=Entomobacter blattae TaxID=2762277 RepID=A0A7H1NSM8_9PROT|nr:tRNA pseudouridine(38-40) synthase TruA [Entomobacter blattae]QNT78788.1 tRNA pseudouridine synthase A [Entomobacter blattae]
MGISRWAVKLEYCGSAFSGWQRQESALSIQQVLEEAAQKLSGGIPVSSITAGRTDAGVHALGQVAHLDFPDSVFYNSKKIRDGLNFHLIPHNVAILDAAPVDKEWSARFSAISRSYRYIILNRPSRPALDENRVWHVKRTLNPNLMAEGAQFLIGKHDFSSFRATACQAKSPFRSISNIHIIQQEDRIIIDISARSFLHHQVRNIVGTLKLVGEKTWHPLQVKSALEARNRSAAGPTAPACGLYLTHIGYQPDPFENPTAQTTRGNQLVDKERS